MNTHSDHNKQHNVTIVNYILFTFVNMKERLLRILAEYDLNSSRLAEKMGIQRSGISHIMAGRNKPSYDFLVSIIELFPEINANWLLTGEGPMYKASAPHVNDNNQNPAEKNTPEKEQQSDLFTHTKNDSVQPIQNKQKTKISENTDVYNDKHSVLDDKMIDRLIILYKNGKFKTFSPE